ncbi:MAG: thioredoxin domain-containing protein [Rugosibacter sp.]|nr:thioredoxin domain-containing protein [Rugosibacter sp.]
MSSATSASSANRLATATSPYLLQHAHNPVAWQPWDEQALAQAREENRPILLSIGYSACHWCHVMAHESFEDEAVAAVMNRLFVNIKVDREERPDLDQIYQTAHQMLAQRAGGWPLTMFLTPDGTPFFGGTYFPKTPRHGLPAFTDLCEQVAEAFQKRRSNIDEQNIALRNALTQTLPDASSSMAATGFDTQPLISATESLAQSFDRSYGGFGRAPKFPHPTDLAFLLRHAEPRMRSMALVTLQRMAEGGIYDQVGGGFCRYSVDERWEIPHFEKMLYDNGPLLGLNADAWAETGDPIFARVADETAAWVMREMQSPGATGGVGGGYYSALDADSEGEEGKYYVWTREQIQALLTSEQWSAAAPHWGLEAAPNFEGRWHLKVAKVLDEADRPLITTAKQVLYAAREQRIRPGCDDKILTSWNALMIEGMAHAARVFDRPDWLASAQTALDFLRNNHWQDGQLYATSRNGQVHLSAYLDDHAFLLVALLELMQAKFRSIDLAFACELADVLLADFEDQSAGGFFFTAHDHEALILRPKPGHDNATPSGNGIAAFALQRLGYLLGNVRYVDAAERTLRLYWPQITNSAMGFGSLLLTLEETLTPPDRVILRGPAAECTAWQQALGASLHHMILSLPNSIPDLPEALAKPESDHVNAWICRGVHCLAPIDRLEAVKQQLAAKASAKM